VLPVAYVKTHMHAENERHLTEIANDADIIIPCWGNRNKLPRELRPQLDKTLALLRRSGKPLYHFGLTASGDPRHTLMIGYDTPLTEWISTQEPSP
jgi:hypothetical protein